MIEYNTLYTHIVKGGTYKIIDCDALMQIDDVWHKAVIYQKKYDEEKKKYVRQYDSFTEKFKAL